MSPRSAGLLVVASMVGTGVFGTGGVLLRDLGSGAAMIGVWLLGGVIALCGALVYAELGSAFPKSGGEYRFLSTTLHPAVGFAAAVASLAVGFAAPIAAVALGFGKYLSAVWPSMPVRPVAAALIILLSGAYLGRVELAQKLQDGFTWAKIALIVAVVFSAVVALWWPGSTVAAGTTVGERVLETPAGAVTFSTVAVSLLSVSFSYTGYNAAAYVAGEVRAASRSLPKALLAATAAVTALYVLLNVAFLMLAPVEVLSGRVAVAHAALSHAFGTKRGNLASLVIALGLVSTVGAMIVSGSRLYEAVGEDYPRLSWLRRRRPSHSPRIAIVFQASLSLGMLWLSSFEQLLQYVGFTLSIFSALCGVVTFVVRRRGQSGPFRMPFFPLPVVVFLALTTWMVVQAVIAKPMVGAAGAATLLGAGALWFAAGKSRAEVAKGAP